MLYIVEFWRSCLDTFGGVMGGRDVDILTIQDRIRLNIGLRESQFREFKSAWEGRAENRVSRDPREIAHKPWLVLLTLMVVNC